LTSLYKHKGNKLDPILQWVDLLKHSH